MKRLLFVLALSLLSSVSACAARRTPAPAQPPAPHVHVDIGDKLPAFEARSVNTPGAITLVPGKVNIVALWATWHVPSMLMFRALEALRLEYDARGLAILAISVEDGDAQTIAKAAKEWGAGFPVGWDPEHRIVDTLDFCGMPTVLVIDRAGVVRQKRHGWRDHDDVLLEADIAPLL
jgi:hypothetical protein